MLIKLEKIISCTSEHPSYPASNLLQQRTNSSWRCAQPGVLLASVIFQLAETSTITGLDIGNYRSCIVVITASTADEPDNWIPIVNHQFMTHDEAANSKFKDQVQLFTKKELNAETLKTKFDRIKVTCMQSANLRELFGLSFIVFRTEVTLQMGNDIFGRFKLKDTTPTLDVFKEKCMKQLPKKTLTYKESLAEKIKENSANAFAKRQEEPREPMKRPILDKMEENENLLKEENKTVTSLKETKKTYSPKPSTRVARTPFGDVINSDSDDKGKKKGKRASTNNDDSSSDEERITIEKEKNKGKRMPLDCKDSSNEERVKMKKGEKCSECASDVSEDRVCKICNCLPRPKPLDAGPPVKKPKIAIKAKKEFGKLFEGIAFALSGYVNPQRDEIRRKALKMGGKYVADPNTTTNKCTHLICAFSNTPKSQQLRGHTHIVSHKFIEECYDKKIRFPWRRFALDKKERKEPESEEEIEAGLTNVEPPDPYQQDTDSDSNY